MYQILIADNEYKCFPDEGSQLIHEKYPSAKMSLNNLIMKPCHTFHSILKGFGKQYIFYQLSVTRIYIFLRNRFRSVNKNHPGAKNVEQLTKYSYRVNIYMRIIRRNCCRSLTYWSEHSETALSDILYIYILYNIHDKRTIAAENTYFWMFHLGINQQWPMLINMHVVIWYN